MFPFAATVATEQPKVPSPGPLRTVTITLQAELCVRTERSPQQTETILTGPPSALYLLIHVLPKAVQRCGVVARTASVAPAATVAKASGHRSARIGPSRRTALIVPVRPTRGNPPPSN